MRHSAQSYSINNIAFTTVHNTTEGKQLPIASFIMLAVCNPVTIFIGIGIVIALWSISCFYCGKWDICDDNQRTNYQKVGAEKDSTVARLCCILRRPVCTIAALFSTVIPFAQIAVGYVGFGEIMEWQRADNSTSSTLYSTAEEKQFPMMLPLVAIACFETIAALMATIIIATFCTVLSSVRRNDFATDKLAHRILNDKTHKREEIAQEEGKALTLIPTT